MNKPLVVPREKNKTLLINDYMKNDFNGYSRRIFIAGTPIGAQQQQEQQQEHLDMPR